jgi:hypothetical protein
MSPTSDDPKRTSPLRQPGDPHPLINAFPTGKVCRIVTRRTQTVVPDGEFWVEHQRRSRDRLRLV